jgi:DNA polymerase-3 subunit alpha
MADNIMQEPELPLIAEWSRIDMLNKEKEVTGIFISGHPLDDYQLELDNYVTCPLDMAGEMLDTPLSLAGMVSEVFHGTTQKGLGYGKFTIQDFRGSLQLSIYNEAYKSYRDLINKGEVLFVEGIYAKGYNSDNYFFRVKDIKLLDTIGKTMTKSITVQLPIDQLDQTVLADMSEICKAHKGSHQFKVIVTDGDTDLELSLVRSAKNIKVDTELLEKISKLGLKYKLN